MSEHNGAIIKIEFRLIVEIILKK